MKWHPYHDILHAANPHSVIVWISFFKSLQQCVLYSRPPRTTRSWGAESSEPIDCKIAIAAYYVCWNPSPTEGSHNALLYVAFHRFLKPRRWRKRLWPRWRKRPWQLDYHFLKHLETNVHKQRECCAQANATISAPHKKCTSPTPIQPTLPPHVPNVQKKNQQLPHQHQFKPEFGAWKPTGRFEMLC